MIDLNNINNNIIANRWRQRYAELSNEIKQKLDRLDNASIKEYQLQVIKRKREYPQIGDVFQVNPKENIILHGIVLNNHINNINGEDLLLIMIFSTDVNVKEIISKGIQDNDLIIPPAMVGKEYWTRGYFYNIDSIDNLTLIRNYGFYSIGKGKFFDEYGNELMEEPDLLGTYGVTTITGIAREINQELIMSERI